MLDRPQPRTLSRQSFDEWWRAQSPEYRSRIDDGAAWTIFQAGYAAGRKSDIKRFIYRAGRLRITVWARSADEARKTALMEADARAALRGWKPPAGGWILEKLT
jgi:predicted phage gp36 major capsid-like protein